MFDVAFAFVVAAALALAFRNTRWLGVVGTFVLLAIHPVFFTTLLLLTAAVAYWVHRVRRP